MDDDQQDLFPGNGGDPPRPARRFPTLNKEDAEKARDEAMVRVGGAAMSEGDHRAHRKRAIGDSPPDDDARVDWEVRWMKCSTETG